MHRSVTTHCCRLALRSAAALALTIAPYQIAFHGSAPGIHAASAQAGKGGNGGGNNGNGNGNGGGNGSNGNSSGNGNSGNGNGNGNSSSGNSGDDGNSNAGSSQDSNGTSSHVNAATGDKVDVAGKNITVVHPDGITEKVESGRFKMQDALGRTIIDRQATPADTKRLKAL